MGLMATLQFLIETLNFLFRSLQLSNEFHAHKRQHLYAISLSRLHFLQSLQNLHGQYTDKF